jgi:hypothetical protein
MHKIVDDLAEGRMESNRADGRMESKEYRLGQRPNAVSAAGNLAPKRSIPILRSNYQPCEPISHHLSRSHKRGISPGHTIHYCLSLFCHLPRSRQRGIRLGRYALRAIAIWGTHPWGARNTRNK